MSTTPGPARPLRSSWRNYIGGQWVDGMSGKKIMVENLATGEILAEVACAESRDVDAAVSAARRCFELGSIRDMIPPQRMALMFRVAAELVQAQEEIAWAEYLDSGKRITNARMEATGAARYFT